MNLPSKSFPCTVLRDCDVCGSDDFETLARCRSAILPYYTAPVSICRDCGFITVRPRPSSADYKEINDRWYPFKFAMNQSLDGEDDKKFRKWRVMWDRIKKYYPQGPNSLLDIGAGQGWAIEFIKNMFSETRAVAIEQWKPSQDYIVNQLGGEIVDRDINDDWPDALKGQFELVILRHTLEHIEEPRKVLRQISQCLSPTGYAYIVVPNTMAIRPGIRIRTDYFRPVHLHYFNVETLARLAGKAGLVPAAIDSRGEVWGVFRRGGSAVTGVDVPRIGYDRQRDLILERMSEARWKDFKAELRMRVRWWIKGPPRPLGGQTG